MSRASLYVDTQSLYIIVDADSNPCVSLSMVNLGLLRIMIFDARMPP
jgi:hypothetical protein